MNIERATPADARAVAQIHVDAWRAAYAGIVSADWLAGLSVEGREAEWSRSIATGTPEVLVARDAGAVRGWIAFGACRDAGAPPSRAEVWALYVAPRAWSTGAGRALWARARDLMRAQGRTTCSLWVFPENDRAIRFYRSLGFAADALPAQPFDLGGQQLLEARYVCRLDG